MGSDGVEQGGIVQPRIIQPQFRVGRILLPQAARSVIPAAPTSSMMRSRLGGVLRYSITWGSTPDCRIMASVLREVPQSGLW
jgi:hypothetical protein